MAKHALRWFWLAGLLAFAGICGSAESEEIPLPETTPFAPEVETRVHAIRDRVMELRGLKAETAIQEGTLSRDALRAYYDEVEASVDEDDRREIETFNTVLRMLRIIEPDDDLLALSTDFGSEGTLGFYAYDDEKLVLVEGPEGIDREAESTLAHEYVHALQFAAFDTDHLDELREKEDDKENSATEYGTTVSCLLEGDAELAQAMYEAVVLGPEPPEPPSGTIGNPPAADGNPYEGMPSGYLRYMMFDYIECEAWTQALFAESGWNEINRAYSTPPWTTEQILHPEKYLAREQVTGMQPIDLTDRLGKGWEQATSGVFGEFDVYNYLVSILGSDEIASQAAAGWGVGWLGAYADKADKENAEERVVVHVALEFDSDQDYAEFSVAYGMVVGVLSGGAAEFSPDEKAICWDGELEHAYVSWDDRQRRFDIVMASDEDALKAAASQSLSTANASACPGW